MKLSLEERDVWFNRNPHTFGEPDSSDGEVGSEDMPRGLEKTSKL